MSKENSVGVYIDIQNLYHSAKHFSGGKINYKMLLDLISEGRTIEFTRGYAAHKDIKSSKNFYNALKAIGVDVYSKPVIVKHDKTTGSSKVISVHFDVEISVDAMDSAEKTVILCTGNGNFRYLIDNLLENGFNVEIWSFADSTSDLLVSKDHPNYKFKQIPTECLLTVSEKESVSS